MNPVPVTPSWLEAEFSETCAFSDSIPAPLDLGLGRCPSSPRCRPRALVLTSPHRPSTAYLTGEPGARCQPSCSKPGQIPFWPPLPLGLFLSILGQDICKTSREPIHDPSVGSARWWPGGGSPGDLAGSFQTSTSTPGSWEALFPRRKEVRGGGSLLQPEALSVWPLIIQPTAGTLPISYRLQEYPHRSPQHGPWKLIRNALGLGFRQP